MPNIKIKSMYIEQFKAFKKFQIDFEEDVMVIVGENGTGKTSIFEIIYNAFTQNKSYFNDTNLTNIKISISVDGAENELVVQKINDEIEILLENTENKDFFNFQKVLYFPADIKFTNYSINGPAKIEEEIGDIRLDSDKLSKDLKQYLVNAKFLDLSDMEENKSGNRIEHLKKIFNNFFSDKEFFNIDVKDFEPIFKLKETGEFINLNDLSLGEKQVFYRGCSLIQYTEDKGLIILIDEPETSLHPEWQQKILNFYKNINSNNQYIFASHSPHIVACCGREKVRVIEKIGSRLMLREDINETYGATNEELLFNIFNLESVRNIEIQKYIDRYRDLYYRRDFISDIELEELKQLKEKLLSMKSLPKDFIPLLELKINTKRLDEI